MKRKKGKKERAEEKDWTPEAHKYGQEGEGPRRRQGRDPTNPYLGACGSLESEGFQVRVN